MIDPTNRTGFFPGTCIENNVVKFIAEHYKNKPDSDILRWIAPEAKTDAAKSINPNLKHNSISIRDFYENINRISHGLREAGFKKGDRVIMFLPMSVELFQVMFAFTKIGAIAAFLDTFSRESTLPLSAKIVAPKGIVSYEFIFDMCKVVPELDEIPMKIVVGPHTQAYALEYEKLLQCPQDRSFEPVDGEDTAIITFTSGSSGIPKGADRTHQFLAAQHYVLSELIPYDDKTVDFPAFPIFAMHDIASGVPTIIPGADVSAPKPEDPVIIASQFLTNKVRSGAISISMIRQLNEYSRENKIILPDVQRLISGGAPVTNDLIREFVDIIPNGKIIVAYGSTEAEPISLIDGRDILFPPYPRASTGDDVEEGVNVGQVYDGMDIKFIKIHKGRIELGSEDWASWELPRGEIGEIIVSGIHVCKRYFKNPEITKDIKMIDNQGKLWHRTGDLGFIDTYGRLWLVGRVHNVIGRAGKTLFPIRAETIMKRIAFVDKAAFLGMPDEKLGEKTYAIVTPRSKMSADEIAEGKAKIRETLESSSIPVDEVLIINEITMDPRHHSKVEYKVLKDRIAKGEL